MKTSVVLPQPPTPPLQVKATTTLILQDVTVSSAQLDLNGWGGKDSLMLMSVYVQAGRG